MMPFGQVGPPWWHQPVYIIGGGPSLRDFDVNRLRGKGLLLGVNKSAFWADCDALFSLDQRFVREHRDDIQAFARQGKEVFLAVPPNENKHRAIEEATYLYRRSNPGLSTKPADIFGVNSGYGALGVAFLKDAREIALLGFDMDYAADGRTHCHEGYPWHAKRNHKFMDRWATNFDLAAQQLRDAGVTVVNFVGRPESKIPCFPKMPLEDL